MKKTSAVFMFFIITCFITTAYAQKQTLGHPMHLFFEYGPLGNVPDASATKNGSHLAAGIKKHSWIEDRPLQIEFDMNYRSISFYDSAEVKNTVGMGEMYIGPRLLISKTSPLYPTLSVLGGGYLNLDGLFGLNALLTGGIYYNLTSVGSPRNGLTFEVTYHLAKINFNGYSIPPAVAVRIGFFF